MGVSKIPIGTVWCVRHLYKTGVIPSPCSRRTIRAQRYSASAVVGYRHLDLDMISHGHVTWWRVSRVADMVFSFNVYSLSSILVPSSLPVRLCQSYCALLSLSVSSSKLSSRGRYPRFATILHVFLMIYAEFSRYCSMFPTIYQHSFPISMVVRCKMMSVREA